MMATENHLDLVHAIESPRSAAYQDLFDDVFGPSDQGDESRIDNSNLFSEDTRLRSTHTTNGYRDGIAESKSLYVQAGFDEGYPLGAVLGYRTAWLLTTLGTMLSLSIEKDHIATSERLTKLLKGARTELAMESLFSESYFDKYAVWTYLVDGEDGSCDLTQIGDHHPLITKWTAVVDDIALSSGLRLGAGGSLRDGAEG